MALVAMAVLANPESMTGPASWFRKLFARREPDGIQPLTDDETGPVASFGLGTADDVFDAQLALPLAVREFLARREVLARLPSVGSGNVTVSPDFPWTIRQPIEAGNEVASGNIDLAAEQSRISTWVQGAHRLASKASRNAPRLAQVVLGADPEKGTSGLRVLSANADRFRIGDAIHLTLLTQPRKGPMPWVKRTDAESEVVKLVEDVSPSSAPRELSWRRGRTRGQARPTLSVVRESSITPALVLAKEASCRMDWLIQGLLKVPDATVDMVVVDPGAPTSVDPVIRQIFAIRAYVASKGTAGGSGVEVRRIPRELREPLAFGSFLADPIEVANAHGVTGIHRRFQHGARTLAGYTVDPRAKGKEGSSRKAVLYGLGSKTALERLPQVVRDGLGIDAENFVACCAPAPIEGAIAQVWLEADEVELLQVYPDLTSHPWWPAVESAITTERERLNQMDGEAQGAST